MKITIISLFLLTHGLYAEVKPWATKLKNLTSFEKHVIVDKGTEGAWSGKYVKNKDKGIYQCKVCGTSLYKSDDKFDYYVCKGGTPYCHEYVKRFD